MGAIATDVWMESDDRLFDIIIGKCSMSLFYTINGGMQNPHHESTKSYCSVMMGPSIILYSIMY